MESNSKQFTCGYCLEDKTKLEMHTKNMCHDCRRKKDKERKKKHYEKNKQAYAIKNKIDYDNNREKILEKKANYYKENRESIIAKFTEKYQNDLEFRLKHVVRRRTRNFISDGTIKYQEMIGCSHDHLINWFEYNFSIDNKNMNWENYGSVWQIDHVFPLSKVDETDDEMFCYTWKNLRPMLSSDNIKKTNHIDYNLIENQKNRVEMFLQMRNNLSVFPFPTDLLEREDTAVL